MYNYIMALHTSTSIIIGDKILHFQNVNLYQGIAEHHSFSIMCRLDQFQDLDSDFIDTFNMIGEKITIFVSEWSDEPSSDSNSDPQFEFRGVITAIDIIKGDNSGGGDNVIINGKSPTYLADQSTNFNTFEQQGLSDILTTVFNNDYTRHFQVVQFETNSGQTLSYSVRYNETPWAYINRLATQYGYWFYFNGINLYFNNGGPGNNDEAILEYGFNLQEFTLGLEPQFQGVSYYDTDYKDSGLINRTNEDCNLQDQNNYITLADSKANEMDSNSSAVWYNTGGDDQPKTSIFNDLVDINTHVNQTKQIYLSGGSTCVDLKLGNIVSIKKGDVDYGKWRISHISHYMNSDGQYSNNFECVLANVKYNIKSAAQSFPKVETQVAIVKSNDDPDKLGRVKVQFPWQKDNEQTPWIRVINLYTGHEFGSQFIPEINNEVLIGFNGGNVERPYVMGQFYNISNSPLDDWSTANNDIKGIKTKSGNMLIFNDDEGSITLKDKAGSSIVLDGNGNISISASGEVSISGKEEVSLQSDDEVSLNGASEVSLESGNEVSIHAASEVSIKSDSELNAEAINLTLTGNAQATLEGTIITVDGTAMTEIKGAQVKLN